MRELQKESANRAAMRHPEAHVAEEALLERAVGDSRTLTTPAEPSLLQPQQNRHAVWRWHIRRRRR